VKDSAPALNTLLGVLPEPCDAYYIHDIAILPEARSGNAGKAIATFLKVHGRAAGFDTICLVAVNNSAPFWERQGFATRDVADLQQRLRSYGTGVTYMTISHRDTKSPTVSFLH
jgi:N-acetylglutamate synthase-like GNAT family acetyltransferase